MGIRKQGDSWKTNRRRGLGFGSIRWLVLRLLARISGVGVLLVVMRRKMIVVVVVLGFDPV